MKYETTYMFSSTMWCRSVAILYIGMVCMYVRMSVSSVI